MAPKNSCINQPHSPEDSTNQRPVTTEYDRYRKAEDLLLRPNAGEDEIIEGLAGIVDLTGHSLLLAGDLGLPLPAEIVAMVGIPDPVHRLAGVTWQGELVCWRCNTTGNDNHWEPQIFEIPDFVKERDTVLGIYCSRSITRFRKRWDLLVTARIDGKPLAFETPAANPKLLRFAGDSLLDWLRACPVSGPPGTDLIDLIPLKALPASPATGAAFLDGRLYSAFPGATGKDDLDGRSISPVGGQLLVVSADHELRSFSLDLREMKLMWKRVFPLQPACLAELASNNHTRQVVIAFENGLLSLSKVIEPALLNNTWLRLKQRIKIFSQPGSPREWCNWADGVIRARKFQPRQTAAVLRVLLEQLLIGEDMKYLPDTPPLFGMIHDLDTFQPLLEVISKVLASWKNGTAAPGAAVLLWVYDQLPFCFRDVFDATLLRTGLDTPFAGTSIETPDARAAETLIRHARTTRPDVLADPEAKPAARLAEMAEEWSGGFVPGRMEPLPKERPSAVLAGCSLEEALVIQHDSIFILRPDSEKDCLQEITPRAWKEELFVPSRAVSLPDSPNHSTVFAIGNDRQISIIARQAGTAKPAEIYRWSLPPDVSLLRLRSAGSERIFTALKHANGRQKVYLYEIENRNPVAEGELPSRLFRQTQVICRGDGSWWLLADENEDTLGLFETTLQEKIIQVSQVKRTVIRGRLTTLASTMNCHPLFVAGTTKGYIHCYRIDPAPNEIRLQWIWHGRGAVRDLAILKSRGKLLILALTTGQQALIFDEEGVLQWEVQFPAGLRNGILLTSGKHSTVVISDNRGMIRLYNQSDPGKAIEQAGTIIQANDVKTTDLENNSQWELARVFRSLLTSPDAPPWLGSLITRPARLCLLQWLGEQLGKIITWANAPDNLRETLDDVLAKASLQELIILARLRLPRLDQASRLQLLNRMLEAIGGHSTTDSEDGHDLMRDILAELAVGLGREELVPSRLANRPGSPWHRLPVTPRTRPGVVIAQLMAARPGQLTDQEIFIQLVSEASHLDPAAFECLPLVSPESCQDAARSIAKSIGSVDCFTGPSAENAKDLNKIQADGFAGYFARMLAVLFQPECTWDDAGKLVRAAVESRPELATCQALFSTIREGLGKLEELFTAECSAAPAQEQLDTIIRADLGFCTPPTTSMDPWHEWIKKAGPRLRSQLESAFNTRREELKQRSWLRVESCSVRRLGSRGAILMLQLAHDGRPDDSLDFFLQAFWGFQPLVEDELGPWKVRDLPASMEWSGTVGPETEKIEIRTIALKNQEQVNSFIWPIRLPKLTKKENWAVLDQCSHIRANVSPVSPVVHGLHLLAYDDKLGIDELVNSLLPLKNAHLVNLDQELAGAGPGRIDPAGLTAARILGVAGKKTGRKGKQPGQPVFAYPAEETALRLLNLGNRGPLSDLQQSISRLDRPVLWLLPLPLAASLHAALEPAAAFTPLYLIRNLDSHSGVDCIIELKAWSANKASVSPHLVETAIHQFGGNLRLFAGWIQACSLKNFSIPAEFVDSPQAAQLLQEEFKDLALPALAALISLTGAVTKLPLDMLAEGQRSNQDFSSTPGSRKHGTKGKELIRKNQRLGFRELAAIRSDHRPPDSFHVQGLNLNLQGSDVKKELQPMLQLARQGLNRSMACLRQRGLVQVHGTVAELVEPYLSLIENELKLEPTGRRLAEKIGGGPLLQTLGMFQFNVLGRFLPELFPELPKPASHLMARAGSLFSPGLLAEKELEAIIRELCGQPVQPVAKDNPSFRLVEQFGSGFQFFEIKRHDTNSIHLAGIANGSTAPSIQDLAGDVPEGQVLTVFGRGVPEWPGWRHPRLCPLGEEQLKEIVLADRPSDKFWDHVRNRSGLMAFSPFQAGSALPEESPVFVGREFESREILDGIGKRSFLILGARQIGKTSLLKHILGRIKNNPVFHPLWLDAAGKKSAEEFAVLFSHALGKPKGTAADSEDWIETELRGLKSSEKMPVLFINEVDGLATGSSCLFHRLRSLSEEGICQTVMTGYHQAFVKTRQTDHPFFHWVHGRLGEKAFFLGALGEDAARQLTGKLKSAPLHLAWENDEAWKIGAQILLDRSRRIPYLLQQACQQLVERLDRDRRTTLKLSDVEAVTGGRHGGLVWNYLQQNRGIPLQVGDSATPDHELEWRDLVLAALARQLFFTPHGDRPAPARDPDLANYNPEDFPFTVADAIFQTGQAIERCALTGPEADSITRWFGEEQYSRMLDTLALSLLVAPMSRGDRAYCFSGLIYPLELIAYLDGRHISIDDYILEKISNIDLLLKKTVQPH